MLDVVCSAFAESQCALSDACGRTDREDEESTYLCADVVNTDGAVIVRYDQAWSDNIRVEE